jgi:hypothetical protein
MKWLVFSLTFLLFWALSYADGLWINPQTDPDVVEHTSKGYFELPVGATSRVSSLTEERVLQISENFLQYFEERVASRGKELVVRVEWENPYFTAHAAHEGGKAVVALWGGFLRAPGMSEEIVVTALCHELGHLIGGEPYSGEFSTEGQSDFFASGCAAEFFAAYPEYSRSVSFDILKYCDGHLACARALEGGMQTVRFMEKWGYQSYIPALLVTPAPPAEKFEANTYPSLQCRLDTFAAGARCLVPGSSCLRPSCWWPF